MDSTPTVNVHWSLRWKLLYHWGWSSNGWRNPLKQGVFTLIHKGAGGIGFHFQPSRIHTWFHLFNQFNLVSNLALMKADTGDFCGFLHFNHKFSIMLKYKEWGSHLMLIWIVFQSYSYCFHMSPFSPKKYFSVLHLRKVFFHATFPNSLILKPQEAK